MVDGIREPGGSPFAALAAAAPSASASGGSGAVACSIAATLRDRLAEQPGFHCRFLSRGWRKGDNASEDDRAVAVGEDAVVEMGLDRAGEHEALDVAADPFQILDLVAVANAGHVLVDDRPRVEILGDVVGGGADQLHPALVSA